VEQGVVEQLMVAVSRHRDPVKILRAGCARWIALVEDPAVRQIILTDAPAVLGWQRWREIDEQYGFGITKASLEAAMDAGVINRRPVEPLAHIFLAALSEAAIQIARAEDPALAMDEMSSALWALVESLRTPG
jgi:hypothetical protein